MAVHVTKIACERPDTMGRSLSLWHCGEIAWHLVEAGIVSSIGRETVRRMLGASRLKPWRFAMWLSAKVPRDEAFACCVREICDLYVGPVPEDEMVLSLDEKTSLQPRPRKAPTLPCRKDQPARVEHEYTRDGALNLFAALDTRTGRVFGQTFPRKRQAEMITFLEHLDREIPASVSTIRVVLDNVSTHKGKEVRKWLAKHPRFVFHHPPVHCSWMNQIEQWFSVLSRKRLQIADFTSKNHLEERLMAFISEWNRSAHAFRWNTHSFDKILEQCDHNRLQQAA